ncbi:hypothetical protein AVEN_260165-1 [Araneus ventricosus]|uniref:Uncharacterized protein n=1 Tax=Araneus ventricosus TaxID=182803 RepID=A0A4Y2DM04_ARAVE|nr:hypothetical protein AVEN_260165-1 [Araneus ventricosus]
MAATSALGIVQGEREGVVFIGLFAFRERERESESKRARHRVRDFESFPAHVARTSSAPSNWRSQSFLHNFIPYLLLSCFPSDGNVLARGGCSAGTEIHTLPKSSA